MKNNYKFVLLTVVLKVRMYFHFQTMKVSRAGSAWRGMRNLKDEPTSVRDVIAATITVYFIILQ